MSTVEERIASARDTIILSWWNLLAPFELTMPSGAMSRPLGVYTTFLPAREAQLLVNGEAAAGMVGLQNPIWQTSVQLLPGMVGNLDETEGMSRTCALRQFQRMVR